MVDQDTAQKKPVSVLFVCLGNICRSPMAEGVFRHLTNHLPTSTSPPHPLITTIDSCGTGAYHVGDSPDPRTISVLSSHDITSYRHRARKFNPSADFAQFDYIFAMDLDNKARLDEARKQMIRSGGVDESEAGEVMLFGAWNGKKRAEEVDDPYYGGGRGFEIAYEQLDLFSKNFLGFLEQR